MSEIEIVRLMPGEDLRPRLEALVTERGWPATWIVAAVGSLTQARLRFAGRDEAQVTAGPLEIVALSGTLSVDGVHLHAALADDQGRVLGGHLLAGCPVRTTAELVLGFTRSLRFARELDSVTGFRELVVRRET
jgi:predicted DNA-binding protein with PD1-like motif